MFYKMAMDKVFDREDPKSYEEITVSTSERFFSEYKKGNISEKYKTTHSELNLQQQEQELMEIWEWFYHHKKWSHITPFDNRGGLGDAYILFKHKYWLDLDHPKNLKARPVNPMHKHPMKKLFNAVGRAWMFALRHWDEDHCILHTAQEVPEMLRDAIEKIGTNKLQHAIWDIDSCYPSMPKENIVKAMQHILDSVRNQTRKCKRKFILVPKSKHEKPKQSSRGCDLLSSLNASTHFTSSNLHLDLPNYPLNKAKNPSMSIKTTPWKENVGIPKVSPARIT